MIKARGHHTNSPDSNLGSCGVREAVCGLVVRARDQHANSPDSNLGCGVREVV